MAKSPDAFRTISEVSSRLDTPAHVLRFWESKFSQIKPIKRAGARRYYRPEDVLLLAGIKSLLHEQGMTIKGAQKLLREKGVKHVQAIGEGEGTVSTTIEVAEKAPAAKPVVEPEPVTPKLEISNITAFRPAAPVDAKLGLPENPAPRDEMPPRFFSQRDDAAEAAIKAKSAEILPLLAKLETVRDRMLRS